MVCRRICSARLGAVRMHMLERPAIRWAQQETTAGPEPNRWETTPPPPLPKRRALCVATTVGHVQP